MSANPIGIFDSGIGGTSIWKEIKLLLPNENTLYLADSANAPYGLKGKEMTLERIQYILDNVEGNIELVVHPGFCAPDAQDKSPLYECRVLYSRIKN